MGLVNCKKKKELHKRWDSLYALKALAAFMVVIIHFPVLGKEYMEPFVRTAVPLFYCISGFFLYAGLADKEISKAWRWIRKIIIVSCLLNFFYALWRGVFLSDIINVHMVVSALLTGEGICVPLWYLTAMWQGLVLFIVLRKWKEKWIYAVPFLCFLNPLLGRYCFLYMEDGGHLPTFVRTNCLTVALPYMCMGYLAAKHYLAERWGKIEYPVVLVGCAYAEYMILQSVGVNNHVSYLLVTPPLVVSVFLYAVQYRGMIPRWCVNIGEKHSANVYYFHVAVGTMLLSFCGAIGIVRNLAAPVVFVLAVFVSALLNATRKGLMRWCKGTRA